MRLLGIAGVLLILAGATAAYTASITGAPKLLGGTGAGSVPHCQVQDYDIPASDTITTVNALVECDISATYTVDATVTSGSSGSGQNSASFTAGVPQSIAITLGASVSITGSTYDVAVHVTQ